MPASEREDYLVDQPKVEPLAEADDGRGDDEEQAHRADDHRGAAGGAGPV